MGRGREKEEGGARAPAAGRREEEERRGGAKAAASPGGEKEERKARGGGEEEEGGGRAEMAEEEGGGEGGGEEASGNCRAGAQRASESLGAAVVSTGTARPVTLITQRQQHLVFLFCPSCLKQHIKTHSVLFCKKNCLIVCMLTASYVSACEPLCCNPHPISFHPHTTYN